MDTSFVRKSDIIVAEMDGEMVMMSVENGKYFGIKGVGSLVWDLLAQPVTTDQIIETVCTKCEVDDSVCRPDVEAFMAELLRIGLAEAV